MKRIALIMFFATSLIARECDYQVRLEPLWINLDSRGDYEKQFGNKWVLAGSVTFCKKANESLKIDHLALRWHGPKIQHLGASLYRKFPDKEFLAIEENLVCDSCWNQSEQLLIFNFKNRKQSIGPLSIFYLALTIAPDAQTKLANGHFSLTHLGLPAPLQEYARTHSLTLACTISKNALT